MRTLSKILDILKDGGKPTYEELRYGLLAAESLRALNFSLLLKILGRNPKNDYIKSSVGRAFDRDKEALNSDPKEYLGWEYDPENPAYRAGVNGAIRLLDKIIREACVKGITEDEG